MTPLIITVFVLVYLGMIFGGLPFVQLDRRSCLSPLQQLAGKMGQQLPHPPRRAKADLARASPASTRLRR